MDANFFDSSESVISSRIASSATLALNSGAWFFLFVILDRLSLQAIHLNKWSEIPRPPLNHARRLKALSGLTPYEFVCKRWTSEPDRFILDPIHQMPGPNS
jgi:hypothetical protein